MTDLSRLTVSLTKHGSHKVAELLDRFPPNDVIANTWGKVPGINIDAAQARKVLSASNGNIVPPVWHAAKNAGRDAIDGLVLLAIVFSHHRLIEAMTGGVKRFGVGTISRDEVEGKAYTNIKGEFENLKALTAQDGKSFSFDVRPVLRDHKIGRLALDLFRAKLAQAGWTGKSDAADECVAMGFHHALGMSEAQFRGWTGLTPVNMDELPEVADPDASAAKPFNFRSGHVKRKSGEVTKKGHGESAQARLIHNDIMNKLYEHLAAKHGRANVGTEISGGPTLTSIDLVVKTATGFTFYEIKTSESLRKCIREAMPQLLEYAYWPTEDRATELVIVTVNAPTTDAQAYLLHLRTKFGIPVHHETVSRKTGALSARF